MKIQNQNRLERMNKLAGTIDDIIKFQNQRINSVINKVLSKFE